MPQKPKRKPRGLSWRLPLLKRSVPLLLSIAIHTTAILLVVFTAQVILTPSKDDARELPIIPQAQLADANPGGALKPSNGSESPLQQPLSPLSTPTAKSAFILDRPADPILPGAVGISSSLGIEHSGQNEPTFGIASAAGTPQLPQSQFLGLGGNATRIVYVFDASASMGGKLKFLTDEVKASIALLKPIQSFNVLFFQENTYLAADAKSLVPATDKNKAAVFKDFLNPDKIITAGQTNPLPALEFAFKLNPQLVYLLTDGDFSGPGNPAVIDYCAKQTQNGRIKINTIAFTSPLPENTVNNPNDPFINALKEIAKTSGGQFRQISDYSSH